MSTLDEIILETIRKEKDELLSEIFLSEESKDWERRKNVK